MDFEKAQYPGLGPSEKPFYAFYTVPWRVVIAAWSKEQLLVGYRYYEAKNISFRTGLELKTGLC